MNVVAIVHNGHSRLAPPPTERLRVDDDLYLQAREEQIAKLRERGLDVQPEAPSPDQLTSEKIGLFEIVLAPRSRATSKTLRGIHCREKYDLNVIAIWRNGRPRRVGLGDITLQLGDALLVLGSRDRARVVQSEGEFILFPQHTPRQSRRSQ